MAGLQRDLERGATLVAIGLWTNLTLLEVARPGALNRALVMAAGGWTGLGAGLLPWGPDMDFNVQWDTRAAEIVAATADLTLAPLPVTLQANLRAAHYASRSERLPAACCVPGCPDFCIRVISAGSCACAR